MQSAGAVLRQAAADLDAIGARRAVIGGLAVAFRAEPRFTKDVDLAVAAAGGQEAEGIVNRLQARGYALASLAGQDHVNRLATARLARPAAGTPSAFTGLLFADSGIEDEIVRRAGRLEVLPDIQMPVASTGHLIALKALAARHQDLTDLGYLISAASDADLDEARASAAMIEERGFNTGQNLSEDLTAIISQARKLAGRRRICLGHSVYDHLPDLRLPARRQGPLRHRRGGGRTVRAAVPRRHRRGPLIPLLHRPGGPAPGRRGSCPS